MHKKNYRQPTIMHVDKNDEYARLQDTAILFEEQVFTRTEADREGTIKIEQGQER